VFGCGAFFVCGKTGTKAKNKIKYYLVIKVMKNGRNMQNRQLFVDFYFGLQYDEATGRWGKKYRKTNFQFVEI
jgi:hypothetical protein